jgi:hypothetical protein bfra3_13620
MYLTVEELYTHLHDETVRVISRETEAIPLAAIDAAVAEARSYLHDYDTNAIFSAEGDARNALLLLFVKDIAVWHFVNLGNACIDIELREKRYDSAVNWLRLVQKGDLSPDLPAKKAEPGGDEIIGKIHFSSNPKRSQHF